MSADEPGSDPRQGRQSHRFGGTWTERKLEVLAGYLRSYTTALKNKPTPEKPFRKGFIDAFAGTGYRDARREDDDRRQQRLAFPDLAGDEPQEPRAIDLWVLFPLGIGVNRLLTKSGDIPSSWRRRLDLLLGTEDWYDEFYEIETSPTLFDDDQDQVVKASMQTIGRYFNNRLRATFAGVAEEPGVLRNSVNNPLYLLCFAAANERGATTALRIANHLLRELR